MESNALLEAATRLKQGLLAKATNGEYSNSDFQNDNKSQLHWPDNAQIKRKLY